MATVQELKDRIFRATNHKYTDQFHMVDLLNDALNQLTDGSKLEGFQAIEVVSGVGEYVLPATFKAPIQLIEGDLSEPRQVYPLINIDENKFGYAVFGGKVYLKPLPNSDKTLTLYFYKYATQLEKFDDVPEIDAQWHDLLSTYAAGMITLLPDLDFDKGISDRLMARWEEGKRQFAASMMRKNKQTAVREKVRW